MYLRLPTEQDHVQVVTDTLQVWQQIRSTKPLDNRTQVNISTTGQENRPNPSNIRLR
jgi:hypothetical protein